MRCKMHQNSLSKLKTCLPYIRHVHLFWQDARTSWMHYGLLFTMS